jgi:hypothetical protein
MITDRDFNHWVGIDTKTGREFNATAPDPPTFRRCVAARLAIIQRFKPPLGIKVPKPTLGQFKARCAADYETVRRQALTFLVQSVWIREQAEREGVSVGRAQVAAQEQVLEQQFGLAGAAELRRYLGAVGMSRSDFEFQAQTDALAMALGARAAAGRLRTPTPTQIAAYYATHRRTLVSPQTRELLIVPTATQSAASEAAGLLRAGQPFAQVVSRFSIDPVSRASGGLVKGYTVGEFHDPALDAEVAHARVGALVGPLYSRRRFFLVFKVVRVLGGTPLSLSQATPAIRGALTAAQRTRIDARFSAQLVARWKSRTRCEERVWTPEVCGGRLRAG